MTHGFFKKNLQALLAEELSTAHRELMLNHMLECSACEKLYLQADAEHAAQMERLPGQPNRSEGGSVPTITGMKEAMPSSASQAERANRRSPWRRAAYLYLPAAAAAALLGALLIARMFHTSGPVRTADSGATPISPSVPHMMATQQAPTDRDPATSQARASLGQSSPPPQAPLSASLGPKRNIEYRLSYAPLAEHRPFDTAAGLMAASPSGAVSLSAMAHLEAIGDQHGLGVAWLLRGGLDSAAQAFERGCTGDCQADAAVITALGSASDRVKQEAALRQLDSFLGDHPGHGPTMWNRALVLRDLGLFNAAAEAFAQVAALREPGWSTEARTYADKLKELDRFAAKSWSDFKSQATAMLNGGPVISDEMAATYPGSSRKYFYDALFAAHTSERIAALQPLARKLDELAGSRFLHALLERIRSSDLVRRKPLAERFNEIRRSDAVLAAPEVARWMQELKSAKQSDILLGVLARHATTKEHAAELNRLAVALGDPWFTVLSESILVKLEYQSGQNAKAMIRARTQAVACPDRSITYRCAHLQLQIAQMAAEQHQPGARIHYQNALSMVHGIRDRGFESALMFWLGDYAYYRADFAAARAYLSEYLLRHPEDCESVRGIRERLAMFAWREMDVARAQREFAQVPRHCGKPSLAGTSVAVALLELSAEPSATEEIATWLRELQRSASSLRPTERLWIQYIAARFEHTRNRASGLEKLRQTLQASVELPAEDEDTQKIRGYSYATLIYDSAQQQDWPQALRLHSEEQGIAIPTRCVLAASASEGSLSLVMRDLGGRYLGLFRQRVALRELQNGRGLVPGEWLPLISHCPQVSVLARAGMQGLSELLPSNIAWSFHVGGGDSRPASNSAPLRVVISDVVSSWKLPRLSAWPSSQAQAVDTQYLQDVHAQLAPVLAALENATEVEFHTHGVIADPDTGTTQLLLSDDPPGTASFLDVQALRPHSLRGRPLVTLVSCQAARVSPLTYKAWSLPAGFLRAGARGVLASNEPVRYPSGGEFFSAVRSRIAQGVPAAVALRDVRQAWSSRADNGWTQRVLLFEK